MSFVLCRERRRLGLALPGQRPPGTHRCLAAPLFPWQAPPAWDRQIRQTSRDRGTFAGLESALRTFLSLGNNVSSGGFFVFDFDFVF